MFSSKKSAPASSAPEGMSRANIAGVTNAGKGSASAARKDDVERMSRAKVHGFKHN